MKIAINGDIIDTDNIYKISKIESNDSGLICHKFKIISYNDKVIQIVYNSKCYVSASYSEYIRINNIRVTNPEEMNLDYVINCSSYQETLAKISEFRQSIIDIWSNNQSKIVQFNL